jgi:hypothetical protein
MKKIKNIAIIIQNMVQYESFKPAIDLMKERKYKIDILIPKQDISEHQWEDMYEKTAEQLTKEGHKILREIDNEKIYDIVFTTHEIESFKNIKKVYYIKFRYGCATKPWLSLSLSKNIIYDAILTYGKIDTDTLSNYGKTFEIGNIKYAYYKKEKRKKTNKLNILYLPTYGEDSSYYELVPELIKLKEKYNIMIKLHHGTNHLKYKKEEKIKKLVEENFKNIYSSEESLLEIFKDTDLVISDNSGAIGDAIAAKIPLIVYQEKNPKTYGKFIPIQQLIIQKDLVPCLKKAEDISKCIEKSLTKKYINKMDELFNLLYGCENKETKNKFGEFLNNLENNNISEEYLQIRENIRHEYKNLISIKEKQEIEIESKEEQLTNSYNIIKRLEIENENLKTRINKNIIERIKRKIQKK